MSVGGKVAKGYAWSLGLSLGLSVGLTVLFFGGLCVVPTVAGFVHEDLIAPSFWICFLSIPMVFLPATIAGAVLYRIGLNRKLDRTLEGVGPGAMWMLSGRQWSGEHNGRAAEAKLMRGTFFLTLAGDPPHLIRVGESNALARTVAGAMSAEPVELGGGLIAFTKEGKDLLADPEVISALELLLRDDGWSIRNVSIEPGVGAKLSMRLPRVKGFDEAPQWLDALESLLKAAEA